MTLKPCPFCGEMPDVGPANPESEGTAWGYVQCTNEDCSAQPYVDDGVDVADDRGSTAYQEAAVRRWNRRA